MNKIFRLLPLALFSFTLFASKVKAGNIVAADLTYRHINGLEYEFTLTVYSECDVNLNTPPAFQIDYQSLKCGDQGSFIANLIEQPKVISACGNTITKCQGGQGLGFSKAVYRKIFTLPNACIDWNFSWNFCNRSKEITTIEKPDQNCLYLESTLNNKDFPSNNSPVLPNDPVAFLTAGSSANIIPGTTEKDKDRLEYSLVAPRDKFDTPLKYKSPYSFSNPLASSPALTIDSNNGEIKLTPTKEGERTVLAVLIKEFRDGKLVGSVIRDLQIAVQVGGNVAPTLSGLSNSSRTDTTVTAGRQFCIRLFGSDPNLNQRLTITKDNASNFGTLTSAPSTNPVALFCWIPRDADEGEKKIVFTIKDDQCPQLSFDREIKITVRKSGPSGCENLFASFTSDTTCIGKKTTFRDLSFPSLNITSWKWDFGNGMTSTARNPEVKEYYNKPGFYKVKLIVTDKNKCVDSTEQTVRICEPTVVKISIRSCDKIDESIEIKALCPHQKIILKDESSSPCLISSSEWYEDGKLIGTGKEFNYESKSGPKKITLKNYTFSKCVASKDTNITISGGPSLKTIASYDFKCSKLDTLATINATGGLPFRTNDINKKYVYLWKPLTDDLEFTPSSRDRTTKISYPSDVTSRFRVFAKDSNSCAADTIVEIRNPINIAFSNTSYCEAGDSIRFSIASTSSNPKKPTAFWGIKSIETKLGDRDSTKIINKDEFKHLYQPEGVYKSAVRVVDSSGCVRNAEVEIFSILPDMRFGLSKDTICFFDSSVDYFGPRFPSNVKDGVISYVWKIGADSLNFQTSGGTIEPSSPSNKFPKIVGAKPITLGITYNGSCIKNFEDTLFIRPVALVRIDSVQGKCVPFPVTFFTSFPESNTTQVTSISWKYFWRNNSGALVEVDNANTLEPTRTFLNHGNHFARISSVDNKGCNNTQDDYLFRVEKIAKPLFDISGFCANEKLEFAYDRTRDSIGNIFSQFWDFGNGTSATPRKPFFTYTTPGTYKVKLIIYNEPGLKGCRDSSDQLVTINPQPIADFTYDSACFGLPQNFFDRSNPSSNTGDTIRSNTWVFDNKNGDLDSAFTKNTIYQFKNYDQALTASMITVNSYGCGDTLTKPILVYPKPVANFTYDFASDELVPNKPIFFEGRYNPSNTETSSPDVVKWRYLFTTKDSLTSDNGNVTFTYPSLDNLNPNNNKYVVQLITTTKDGCTDTIVKPLDLNAYIIVPNTITPNTDDFGNKFEIISRGIVKVNEYKIYNRWGEVVFDGKNDLNSKWDGTYNNLEQPMGVFVYYISATTIYGEEKILKGNLTLLR